MDGSIPSMLFSVFCFVPLGENAMRLPKVYHLYVSELRAYALLKSMGFNPYPIYLSPYYGERGIYTVEGVEIPIDDDRGVLLVDLANALRESRRNSWDNVPSMRSFDMPVWNDDIDDSLDN